MKKFVLLFRMDIISEESQPSKEQMTIYMRQWEAWINEIAENDQLADGGNHFSRTGRVLKSGKEMVERPYTSENNSLAGYIIVRAKTLEEATKIASQCPILNGQNTSVEIRETAVPGV